MRAARNALIIIGGPLLLLVSSISSLAMTLRALSRHRSPHPCAVAGAALTVLYAAVIRPWHLSWGRHRGEDPRLPGDEVLLAHGTSIWHSVEIDAPADEVWPWVAQLGQDRGGFYSYEWLENLAGCEMVNADEIHSEWQEREVGDEVKIHPEVGLEVTVFEPGRVLGIKNWGNVVVDPLGPDRCRVIAHGRIGWGLPSIVYALLIELPHFFMERRMLLGIKERAERTPCSAHPA